MHVGQIPVVKWDDKDTQGILTQRLFHKCYDLILDQVKHYSHEAKKMLGPGGYNYKMRLFCLGVSADNPEQLVIAARQGSASPISQAKKDQFGHPEVQPLRTKDEILKEIQLVKKEVLLKLKITEEPVDPKAPNFKEARKTYLKKYTKVALAHGLNGVDEPFWRDWFLADPCMFLVPDPLHQWFKLFQNHIFEWAKSLLGNEELDKRLSVLQPMVGYRHFTTGVTRYRQHTCRENRDLLRYLVAIIHGHESITGEIMTLFRAFVDYVYIGQYECHSPETIGYLREALDAFHANKHHLAFLRDGPQQKGLFNIPKVEMMHHPPRLIPLNGTTTQFSTEHVERCHIIHAKIPYNSTNKKQYASQMCRFSDRMEKLYLFDDFLLWHLSEGDIYLGDNIDDDSQSESDSEPGHDWESDCESDDHGVKGSRANDVDGSLDQAAKLRSIRAANLLAKNMPKPVLDGFSLSKGGNSDLMFHNSTTAFKLTCRVTHKNSPLDFVADKYNIPDLRGAIGDHLRDKSGGANRRGRRISHSGCQLPFSNVDVWDHVQLQLRATQDELIILPFQTVQALPPDPGNDMPFGRCNFVLIDNSKKDNLNANGINNNYIGLAFG